ncbi:ZIP family metal transporter [Mucilaginibacter myungsuensis]|uniref:ZIP family metal transporter n=1 Tax=Mucilaginibacter myungsuensis TaxID=649104 RepID=A0A929KVS1_9SPHI|nr:ZIP family metal transporter [Mucilaginibacter myungsuensis]MBE9662501.1 ZIP family metal transporter [Mucilaginibacter myungsuensis]MDN3597920.1 ZIP family metal transporter [Mucilaginibacter myungsuensis]
MAFWKILVLFLAAFGGGISVFLFKGGNHKQLKLVLSFSGAYLFGITVLHLIPDAYHGNDNLVGVFILIGFLFQIVLEQFSDGIEHGHIHAHAHPENKVVFPLGIMISLCLHGFLEGMPLAEGQQNELIFGIALHHIPAAFALGSVLLSGNQKKSSTIFFLFLFAIMAPAGYYFSNAISTGGIGNLQQYFNRIMGVVIGIFLHISTVILFESSADHKFNMRKMVAVLLGMGIALSMFLLEL